MSIHEHMRKRKKEKKGKKGKLSERELENLVYRLEGRFKEFGELPKLTSKEQARKWEQALELLKKYRKYAEKPARWEFYDDLIKAMKEKIEKYKEEHSRVITLSEEEYSNVKAALRTMGFPPSMAGKYLSEEDVGFVHKILKKIVEKGRKR